MESLHCQLAQKTLFEKWLQNKRPELHGPHHKRHSGNEALGENVNLVTVATYWGVCCSHHYVIWNLLGKDCLTPQDIFIHV